MNGGMTQHLSHLHGQTLTAVALDRETHEWVFTFTGQCTLRVAAPWRLVNGGHIRVGGDDDGQRFGLGTPVRARELITRLVERQPVVDALAKDFGDLHLRFDSGPTLQVFNGSAGYEGWQLFGPGERTVVAHGGGLVTDSGTVV
jgi:hypothetical protein